METRTSLTKAILQAGLIVGTLDILAAIIQTLLAGGNIERLFQYIASGVFGPSSFEGGALMAWLGLIFHYMIALSWTVLFFLVFPKVTFAPRHRVLTGIGYGCVVWFMMNRIVLPMSNVRMGPFDWSRAMIAAIVLMVAIGLPLSFLANRYYSKSGN